MANYEKKKKELAGKVKESSFGLPHGEKETPQLRKRFKNYETSMKKKGMWGIGKNERHLHKQNSFYEFNKPDYDK